jgi:hypothetical protein
MVSRVVMCVSIETLQNNNGVCGRHIAMQRMLDGEKKNSPQYVKMSTLCLNITQQTDHFIAPDSIVGFNAPYWDWV